jgi:hypothetical protein
VKITSFRPQITDTKYQHQSTQSPPAHLYKIKVSNHKTHKNLLTLLTLLTLSALNFSPLFNNPHMGFRTSNLQRRFLNTDNYHHKTFIASSYYVMVPYV